MQLDILRAAAVVSLGLFFMMLCCWGIRQLKITRLAKPCNRSNQFHRKFALFQQKEQVRNRIILLLANFLLTLTVLLLLMKISNLSQKQCEVYAKLSQTRGLSDELATVYDELAVVATSESYQKEKHRARKIEDYNWPDLFSESGAEQVKAEIERDLSEKFAEPLGASAVNLEKNNAQKKVAVEIIRQFDETFEEQAADHVMSPILESFSKVKVVHQVQVIEKNHAAKEVNRLIYLKDSKNNAFVLSEEKVVPGKG
ncbi:hypothetical protein CBF27_06550 [Vagococcus acidifermentans]|uniref:Uncharacterized protein n=1 Tax=Vagococcus acidifermentans TaxID=564710 RepID=A0A430AVI8_9ENTE|nr:hypothetical protein CBF27_06550 [Vagococcus acidifermentans]